AAPRGVPGGGGAGQEVGAAWPTQRKVVIHNVPASRRDSKLSWVARRLPLVLLAVITLALAVGGGLHLAGTGGAGNAAWRGGGAGGSAYGLWAMAGARGRRRVGVDVIALLALVGAMAVGELLAAAVIAVMLASGRALEAWAAGRARRDLRALLERAPRTAPPYRGQAGEAGPLGAGVPGGLLPVAPRERGR